MMLLKRLSQSLCKNTFNMAKQQPILPIQNIMIENPLVFKSMIYMPLQNFGFSNFPKMFKTQYKKGRLSGRSRTKNSSWKRGFKKVLKPHRQQANQSLLKRIRIVGPSWDRKLKFKSANHRHQLRKKSSACLKRKRRARYANPVDFKRLRRLIPLIKRSSFKAQH